MKKRLLFIVMLGFLHLPIVIWLKSSSHSIGSDLPINIYLGIRIYDFGRILGLAGFILIFFQYVMSSRIKLIERGVGLDKIMRLHRRWGIIGLISIIIHPIAILGGNLLQGDKTVLFSPLKIIGFVALTFLCLAAGAAILYKYTHIKYETWKNVHRIIYAVFPLAFFHSIRLGSNTKNPILRVYWWILLVFYLAILLYKIWMRFHVRRFPFNITRILQETHDTWSLFFQGKVKSYKPGQFLFIQLLKNGKVSESHPFTISSSPTRDEVSISVKSVGDFTSTIRNAKTSDLAYVDKPYGVFSFLNYDAKNLVFIAGGIGITPFISMLRYIYDSKLDKNITLIWGNKSSADIAFKDELEKMASEMPLLKVIYIMSGQQDWQGEKGYVDAEKIKKYVLDFNDTQFFVCGPPVMMNNVIKALKQLGVSKKYIHFERFALR
ncbi:MAG: ferredoxin reductase family protein [Candidatus Poribacteria bacterium]